MELWYYFYLWPWIEIHGYDIGRTVGSFLFLIEYGPDFLSIDKESDGVYMGRSYRTLVLFLFVAMD